MLMRLSSQSTVADQAIDMEFAGDISQVRIQPWDAGKLVAIVREESKGTFNYYCLPFMSGAKNKVDPQRFFAAKFHESTEGLSILALDGDSLADRVICFLGRIEFENGIPRISDCISFVHYCPQPPVSGVIQRLKVVE